MTLTITTTKLYNNNNNKIMAIQGEDLAEGALVVRQGEAQVGGSEEEGHLEVDSAEVQVEEEALEEGGDSGEVIMVVRGSILITDVCFQI